MSIAPTQNQNTAPVFEFDCLFTHDLRKKKKTWHDGCLRFHTFNRRIMVYDDSKNFIGDLHYRDAGDLQEGEELRLDKGVLVDVGRRTGQTETDLAEVLDKGRHGDEVAQSKQATPAAIHQNMQRVPSLNAQGRPKSLAAVLGASQGPIGRARLAIKSPYEQLHSTRPESVIEQPPAKRQRIDTGKENPSRVSKVVRAEQQDRSRPPSFSPSLLRAPLAVRRQVNSSRTVINISSEDEDPVSPPFSSAFGSGRGRQKGTKAMRNPPAKLDLEPKPAKPKQKQLPRLLSVIEAPAVPLKAQDKQIAAEQHVLISPIEEPPAKPQAIRKATEKPGSVKQPAEMLSKTSKEQIPPTKLTVVAEKPLSKKAQGKQKESILPASSARSARLSSGPVTSLRFAPQKSRPKLVYKALLPSSFVASRPGSSRSASATSAPADTSTDLASGPSNLMPRTSKSKHQPEKDLFDLSHLESIPDQHQRAPTPAKSPPRPKSRPPRQESSPLFCTQSPGNVMPDVMFIEDNSPVPSPIKTPLPNPRSDAERSVDDELLEDSPIPVHEPEPAPQLPPVSKLTLMDQCLMMPPPRIEPPSPQTEKPATPGQQPSLQFQTLTEHLPSEIPQPRPFRRVLSESDSPAQVNTMLMISPPAARIPPALVSMQHRRDTKPAEARKPFKSPAKLQRSYSDTAAMLQIEMQRPIGRLSVNVPEVVDEEVDEDVGPWSTREAFLLFDWWPPGREKPDYGDEASIGPHPQAQSFGGFTHPRNAECFGQQLSVIRDEVDI